MSTLTPPIGTKFLYGDPFWPGSHYVVKGYAKEHKPFIDPDDWLGRILFEAQQEAGPDEVRLVFCDRSEAEYVIGGGVSGCIVKVAQITVEGFIAWDAERQAEEESNARRQIGHVIF